MFYDINYVAMLNKVTGLEDIITYWKNVVDAIIIIISEMYIIQYSFILLNTCTPIYSFTLKYNE